MLWCVFAMSRRPHGDFPLVDRVEMAFGLIVSSQESKQMGKKVSRRTFLKTTAASIAAPMVSS